MDFAGQRRMQTRHIAGLDTLRFVAAVIVALSHGAAFPLSAYTNGFWFLRLPTALYNSSFNSVAAVLVFFVISGFCIEYPFATGATFRTAPFLMRRVLRVSIPLIVVWVVARIAGRAEFAALNLVLWSLYCELFYYVSYPALRRVIQNAGIGTALSVIMIASLCVAIAYRNIDYYWEMPVAAMFIVGWPVWLAGCALATAIAENWHVQLPGTIWTWRVGVWILATAAMVFKFHASSRTGFPLLHWPFSFVIVLWVYKEIRHFSGHAGSTILEFCGKASYSLYLVHNPVIAGLNGLTLQPVFQWLLQLTAISVVTLVFYFAIEAPAHAFARSAAKWVAAYKPAQIPAAG